VPVILYNQFRFFFNLYFLFLCVTQFFPVFQVGFLVTYIGPLVFVIGLTMLKEGYDDYKRYLRDKKYNLETFDCYNRKTGAHFKKKSQDLTVGDIVYISKGCRVPADMLVLATKQSTGAIYLKTDQLDGETDWKVRESIKSIQSQVNEGIELEKIDFTIDVPRPSNKIYEFRGTVRIRTEATEPLRLQNTAWASTTVASGDFYGLICYVGKDTRIQMNANSARIKFPISDFEINALSKFLFGFCLLLSLFLTLMKGLSRSWYVEWIHFLVLLCCLIPQSLRTNLDMVKLIYADRINKDVNIEGTVCRNSQITEDLGRVNFLLSDKTGTLTQNVMVFKKITTGLMQFGEEDLAELANMLRTADPFASEKLAKKLQDISLLMYCIMLCNNVQPCFDNNDKRFLQSSSPDEIALVEFAERMGFFMESRDRTKLVVREPSAEGQLREYEVLDVFPFSSARKRMGIILRVCKANRIIYMLKGADTTIKEKVERNGDMVVEEADNLAKEGLRTLAFCYKWVEEAEYAEWKERLQAVVNNLSATEEDEDRVVSSLEVGMKFVGITGVEDLLQESVRDSIESLREAAIKVWVLTGDKVETAKCIAKATGLKQKQENFFEMLDESPAKIENQIVQLSTKKDILIIQGNVLAKLYECGLERSFFQAVQHLNAIMFCRCSPTQKALVVKSVQTHCRGVVCAIGRRCSAGDGGNDVSMIQQADVGVGIEGKEGLQAAMSSDFSILKFKFVKDLLFWHGRLATLSTAYVTLFVMHRGLIIALIQFCFSLFFYFVPVAFYNPYLIIAYTVVYLVLPVVVLVGSAHPGFGQRRDALPRDDLPHALPGLPAQPAPQEQPLLPAALAEHVPGRLHLRARLAAARDFLPQDRHRLFQRAGAHRALQHHHARRPPQPLHHRGEPRLVSLLRHLAGLLPRTPRAAGDGLADDQEHRAHRPLLLAALRAHQGGLQVPLPDGLRQDHADRHEERQEHPRARNAARVEQRPPQPHFVGL